MSDRSISVGAQMGILERRLAANKNDLVRVVERISPENANTAVALSIIDNINHDTHELLVLRRLVRVGALRKSSVYHPGGN